MNIFPVVHIMSAFVSSNSNETNEHNHSKLKAELTDSGYGVKEVMGCYNGQLEKSLVVLGLSDTLAKALAFKYNQESILKLHNDRFAELHFTNGEIVPLGQFVAVGRDEALENMGYTFDETTNTHYIVR